MTAMEIGGDDHVIDGPASRGEAEFVVSCLCAAWSDLVVQDADSDAAVGAHDPSVAAMREFFVYRSRADFESWNRDGASDDNLRTMIHVILGEDSTTVVADPGDELGLRLAEDITKRRSRP
jgi:hypothetical protein